MKPMRTMTAFAVRAAGVAMVAFIVVVLVALAVAWLSPERESVLRPWWR